MSPCCVALPAADVKALSPNTLNELCREIRTTLLHYGHIHGGHIGSNLGMVEATVALHRVFDSPHDRIVFDVSHQSYVHKMLTGRAAAYLDTNRFGDVTGFTNPDESDHDQFVLGHTGTSISLACGLAKTRNMEGPDSGIGNVVAVIGDGSLSSGVAFEGLNNAAEQGGNLIIILNDNEMSIAGDFGGMYGTLARLRASGGTAQPNLFNAFGLDYRYVEHGNDVDALVAAFEEVRNIDHPVVVHIHTLKGAGYDGEPTSSATGIHPSSNLSHREPWHSDHCNLSDHEPHEVSAKPPIGRTRIPPSASLMIRANIMARWQWPRSNRDLPANRDWWSSPPPRQGRTASPMNSANAQARIMWIQASPNRMPWLSQLASHGLAAHQWWPLRPHSSNAPMTSSSRR